MAQIVQDSMPASPFARRRRFSLTRSQLMWTVIGIVVTITIAALAFSNLREVYNSQKDFVVGLLASFAAVCFTKAFALTNENKAVELIRTDPEGPVRIALDEVLRLRLDQQGVFEAVALLERNIEAAQDRLSEYYHAQCQQLGFYKQAPLLRVVISDLDRIRANTVSLRLGVGKSQGDHHKYHIAAKDRHVLISVLRDLRESVKRKDSAYESLVLKGDLISTESWEVFAVMTADILKGELILESLLSQHVRFPPEESLRMVVEYLEAGSKRAREFQNSISQIGTPMVFDIMLADLSNAIDVLRQVDLPDAI